MRIRPAFVTASGMVIALAAIATVVFATTPQEADPGLIRLLWAAIFLAAWGMSATLLLLCRQSMAVAVWSGFWPALATVGVLVARQRGIFSQQLLAGVILATLSVSVFVWWRLRHHRSRD